MYIIDDENIFDHETGIRYSMTLAWPYGVTKQEAETEGTTFPRLCIQSIHSPRDSEPGIVVENEAASKMWEWIKTKVDKKSGFVFA